MSEGFFLMHRGWRENPIFKGEFSRADAWVWLIENACWRPTRFDIRGKTVTLDRGQLCTSRDVLAQAWKWSGSAVERFLTRLETEQMIERQTGQGRTVITISNYRKYQDASEKTGQPTGQPTGQKSDSRRTAKEQGNKGTSIEEEANASPSKRVKPKSIPAEIPDWVPADAWNAFLEMRRSKRAFPTEHAVGLLIKKLDVLRRQGHDPGEVLDQSTMKNWTDIYEIKGDYNGNGNFRSGSGAGFDRRSSLAIAIDEGIDFLSGE